MTVDIDATGYALGNLFAMTLVQLSRGQVPTPLAGVMRHQGEEKFGIHVIADGELEHAVSLSAKPEVQEAAWLAVIEEDDRQLIAMHLCVIPIVSPPFSVIVVVRFDDDSDTLYVSSPDMMLPEGADDTVPDLLWPAINRAMSSSETLRDAGVVFGNEHFKGDAP